MKNLLKKWVGFHITKKKDGVEITFYKVDNGVYTHRKIKPLASIVMSFLNSFYDRVYINFEEAPNSVLPVFFERILKRSINNIEVVQFKLTHPEERFERSLNEAIYRIKILDRVV